MTTSRSTPSLRVDALATLLEPDPARKADRTRELFAHLSRAASADEAGLDEAARLAALSLDEAQQAAMPGRPPKPQLVPAKSVPSRSPFTLEGRAALLHAICHIEFNAIKMELLVSKSLFHNLTCS